MSDFKDEVRKYMGATDSPPAPETLKEDSDNVNGNRQREWNEFKKHQREQEKIEEEKKNEEKKNGSDENNNSDGTNQNSNA